MKVNQGTVNEVARWILIVLLVVIFGGGFLTVGIWMLLDGLLIGLLIAVFAVFWIYLVLVAFYSMAAVTLSDEGVFVRVFVRTKHYSWGEIVQAGVFWRARKYGHYNDLVLLPKTGVPGDHRKTAFMFKNQFHLIHLPYTPDALAYVLSHYGPLNFDHSDGKGMQK